MWMQLFEEEIFEHTFGSAIVITGNNVPVTIVLNSTFTNGFSDQGAAINIALGGALYAKDCRFLMDEKYTTFDQSLLNNLALLRENLNWERDG